MYYGLEIFFLVCLQIPVASRDVNHVFTQN